MKGVLDWTRIAELVAAGVSDRRGDSQGNTDADVHRQWRDHAGDDCFAGSSDPRDSATSGDTEGAAAFRGCAVDREYSGVCAVVLETGRGRSATARSRLRNVAQCVSVSADDRPGRQGCVVDAAFRGLFVSGVQYEHSVFADGHGSVVAVGEVGDDAAVVDIVDDCGVSGGEGGKYFVVNAIRSESTRSFLPWLA